MNQESKLYTDKAEKYLDEAKNFESLSSPEFQEVRKQTLILGSIAASLIALNKK